LGSRSGSPWFDWLGPRCLRIWEGPHHDSLGGSASSWQRGGIARSRVENGSGLDIFFSLFFSLSFRGFVGVLYPLEEWACPCLFPLRHQSEGQSNVPRFPRTRSRQRQPPYSLRCRGAATRVRPEPSIGCRASLQGARARHPWLAARCPLPTTILARSRRSAHICRRHHLCQLAGRKGLETAQNRRDPPNATRHLHHTEIMQCHAAISSSMALCRPADDAVPAGPCILCRRATVHPEPERRDSRVPRSASSPGSDRVASLGFRGRSLYSRFSP
jgi:hypothetical protein